MESGPSNNAGGKDASGKHMKKLALFIGIAGVVCGFFVVMFLFGLSCEHSAVVIGLILAQGALVALAHIFAMLALCVWKPAVFNAYFFLQVS
ncbi:hypothetical protein AAVH_25343 [Aphelenchoides avenae]|nr:hypothetical protein AAVH_25343 [Aphelenchus avenae]